MVQDGNQRTLMETLGGMNELKKGLHRQKLLEKNELRVSEKTVKTRFVPIFTPNTSGCRWLPPPSQY